MNFKIIMLHESCQTNSRHLLYRMYPNPSLYKQANVCTDGKQISSLRGREGEGGIRHGHEKAFVGDVCVHCLDCADLGVYIGQNKLYTLSL